MTTSEEFTVNAPVDKVWEFLADPHRVAAALPGVRIIEKIDDNTYKGGVSVRGGPGAANYEGTLSFDRYEESRTAVIYATGEGPAGAGSADLRVTTQINEISEGLTQVYVDADVTISGMLSMFAGGMIEQVSKRMIKQFATAVKGALETR